MSKITAFLTWLIKGEVRGGDCPECGRDGIVINELDVSCEYCEFSGRLEAPEW